eukprot:scaffold234439_cov29-Tisochrysis_lutea.AAC.1
MASIGHSAAAYYMGIRMAREPEWPFSDSPGLRMFRKMSSPIPCDPNRVQVSVKPPAASKAACYILTNVHGSGIIMRIGRASQRVASEQSA